MTWDGGKLVGEDARNLAEIWRSERGVLRDDLERLRSGFRFEYRRVKRKLSEALESRAVDREPMSLVNMDVTPENIMVRRRRFVGLVDPRPRVGNGASYAAFFICSYRFLLPAYDDTPRYEHHRFGEHRPILNAIADGFGDAYAAGDEALAQVLSLEYFLWVLRVTTWSRGYLESDPTQERYLRAGSRTAIEGRVRKGLLETMRSVLRFSLAL